ncbi:hypothetical protein F0Q45_04655 [Mycobacterium simiae]|uniref:Uncharacterized protein n=1 Tax=Mycobacterium simiae TaxID=1784 RepID=A0A5B1BSP5_MYCSI|nr:hypothetical protein [Mycobacterium simiae]KAA1251356.1 hypothetical protein F0Q45_04655 [Mycobacterium simiae]
MAIPKPNDDGWLDFSSTPYTASLDEVHDCFVVRAPNQESRIRRFDALSLHLSLLYEMGGPSPVWLGGGFVSHNAETVPGIQLVYLCEDREHLRRLLSTDGVYQLLTLQTVFAEKPMMVSIAGLRPVGGLVDAYLASPARQVFWATRLSMITRPDGSTIPGTRKGFVEVTL